MPKIITFSDIKEFNQTRQKLLQQEKADLDFRKVKAGGSLPPAFQDRLDKVNAELSSSVPVKDPVYRTLQGSLKGLTGGDPGPHVGGLFPSSQAAPPTALSASEKQMAAVYGYMQLEHLQNADDPRFLEAVPAALGEYTRNQKLYDAVLENFVNDGDIFLDGRISTRDWIAVSRRLAEQNTVFDDALLPLKIRSVLSKVAGHDDGTPSASLEIVLPDLEAKVDREIVFDNLIAMQTLYFCSVLDSMKLFVARDLALEDWQLSRLILGRGGAGDKFYQMWRKTPFRLNEVERQNLFTRLFAPPNPSLMIRFAAAVSEFARKDEADALLRARLPASVSQEQVRQSARDLAHNLTLRGYGIGYFAAAELKQEVDDIIDLLSDPEVLQAYGARDIYQVLEQIVLLSGGRLENTYQKRITAHSGAVMIRWLANRAAVLAGNSLAPVLDEESLQNPLPAVPGHVATTDPTDLDLVTAVRQWATVNGLKEDFLEQNAEAMEPPRAPTRPIQVPAIARDVLDAVGISMGTSNGAPRSARPNGAYARP